MQIHSEKKPYYPLIVFALCFSSISLIVSDFFGLLRLPEAVGKYIIYAIFIFFLVKCLLKNAFFQKYILLFFSLFLLLGLSYFLFQNTRSYASDSIDRLVQMFGVYLPAAIAFMYIDDYKKLLSALETPVYVLLIGLCLIHLIRPLDSMELGIRLSVLYLLALCTYSQKRRGLKIAILIVAFAFNFMAGRQALIIVLLGLAVFFFYGINRKLGKTATILLSAILIVLILAFYDNLLELLINVLVKLGVSGRGIEKMMAEEVFDTSNRDWIYTHLATTIKNNGIRVNGFFSDRYFLERTSHRVGYYAHNIILEILVDFGWLFGSILCFLLFWLIVKAILKSHHEQRRLLLFICIFTIVRLMVSSSFIVEGNFYLLMGMCISILCHQRLASSNLLSKESIANES